MSVSPLTVLLCSPQHVAGVVPVDSYTHTVVLPCGSTLHRQMAD